MPPIQIRMRLSHSWRFQFPGRPEMQRQSRAIPGAIQRERLFPTTFGGHCPDSDALSSQNDKRRVTGAKLMSRGDTRAGKNSCPRFVRASDTGNSVGLDKKSILLVIPCHPAFATVLSAQNAVLDTSSVSVHIE